MNSSKAPDNVPDSLQYDSDLRHLGIQSQHRGGRKLVWLIVIVAACALTSVAYFAYARFQESRGGAGLEQARPLLEQLAFDPDSPAWNSKADRAEMLLRRAENTSRRPSALLLLGALRCNRGLRIRSDEILSANSADAETADLAIAAMLLYRGGRLPLADQAATLALQRGDERPRALRAATIMAYEMGRDVDVVSHATEWTRISPEDAMAWQFMAFVADDRGFTDDAITALRNQIARTAGNVDDPRRQLIEYLIKAGEAAQARQEFEKLMAAHSSGAGRRQPPDSPGGKNSVALLEARLLFLEGKLNDAERILRRDDFSPTDRVEASLLRARLMLERSEIAEAIPLLRECVKSAPANQEAHYLLGNALARSGNAAEAKRHLEMHRQLLDLKVRINSLERQAGHETNNAEVRLTLANLYRGIGLPEQAKIWQDAANALQHGRSR